MTHLHTRHFDNADEARAVRASSVTFARRWLSFASLTLTALFLVTVSHAFGATTVANVAGIVGTGVLGLSLTVAINERQHLPSLLSGALIAATGVCTVVTSQVCSPSAVQTLTYIQAIVIMGLALNGIEHS